MSHNQLPTVWINHICNSIYFNMLSFMDPLSNTSIMLWDERLSKNLYIINYVLSALLLAFSVLGFAWGLHFGTDPEFCN